MKQEIEHRTKHRTKAEIALAEKLAAQAKRTKPDPKKFASAARLTKAALKSPRHEYNRLYSAVDQLPIHYFHELNESVTGILGPADAEMWRGTTYALALDDGRVIRLPGNRMLHKLIQAADAVGKRVTITYKGKLYYRYGGHYQKVYELEAVDLEREKEEKKAQSEAAKNADSQAVLEEAAAQGNPFAKKVLDRKNRRGGGG